MIDEILRHNRKFVEEKQYERFLTSKYPDKKIAIVTCMDTRLVELLPAALGLRNGDVKIIKNAGGVITNPFDSTMRSLLIAVYELGVEEIMVIGHTGCGVQGMNSTEMLHLMKERGVPESNISLMRHCGIDLEQWLHGFDEVTQSVIETVDLIRNHPLMTAEIRVAGYVIDSTTASSGQSDRPLPPTVENISQNWVRYTSPVSGNSVPVSNRRKIPSRCSQIFPIPQPHTDSFHRCIAPVYSS